VVVVVVTVIAADSSFVFGYCLYLYVVVVCLQWWEGPLL
jgi:hypothetical protein